MNYLLMLVFTLPLAAGAAGLKGKAKFCAKMTCGIYEGQRGGEAGATTTIEISADNSREGRFLYTVKRAGQEDSVWDLNVLIRSDGRFDLTDKNGISYARGICNDRICTYGMHPFANKDGVTWGNFGILQFKDDSLELLMSVGFPSDFKSFLTVLAKK